jgi:hypothetical protein
VTTRRHQDIGKPVALSSGIQSRRPTDLTSSRATPLSTCSALLPRWSRRHMVNACPRLLPSSAKRLSACSTASFAELIHNDLCISGLIHAACTLAPFGFTPHLSMTHANFATGLLTKLWPGGTRLSPHPLGSVNQFPGFISCRFLQFQGFEFLDAI